MCVKSHRSYKCGDSELSHLCSSLNLYTWALTHVYELHYDQRKWPDSQLLYLIAHLIGDCCCCAWYHSRLMSCQPPDWHNAQLRGKKDVEVRIMEPSRTMYLLLLAIHGPFLSSIDPSGKDNRHIDFRAQQLAWFTHQFRLILSSPQSRRIALTDSWPVGLWSIYFLKILTRCEIKKRFQLP